MANVTRQEKEDLLHRVVELQEQFAKTGAEDRETLHKKVETLSNELKEIKDRIEDEKAFRKRWIGRFWTVTLPAFGALVVSFVLWAIEWFKLHWK